MENYSKKHGYFRQINLYERLVTKDGKINKKYFLQDGLHLNEKGYSVLSKLLKKDIKEAGFF